MSPSRIFILRPIATSLLMVAIMLTGMVAYKQLPISALPEVDYPTIQVITFYPGASPDVMASSVTAPLERQFGQVPGLQQMTSTSSDGSSVITLQFSLSLNIDVAEQEVQQSINASGTYLPVDLPTPPIYSKSNPADTPILTLALTSDAMPLSAVEDLRRYAPGAEDLAIAGRGPGEHQRRPEAGRADSSQPDGHGLLRHQPGGSAHRHRSRQREPGERELRRRAPGLSNRRERPVAFERGLQAHDRGVPEWRAGEIDGRGQGGGRHGERPAGRLDERCSGRDLNIQRQPGANIIAVVDRIKLLLPTLTTNLPQSIHVKILTDRTNTIRASVADVQFELGLTVVLVVLVMFVFLRNVSATIIPSVAVPLSLVGTLGVMYLLGYSLNNLTLMALTIATGFVVDDAIVMIENITRYIEEGETAHEGGAARLRADRVHHHIADHLADCGADPAVVHGRHRGPPVPRIRRDPERHDPGFRRGFADADAHDGFQAAEAHPKGSEGRFYEISERGFNGIVAFYGRTLQFVLRFQTITLLVAVATLVVTILLFYRIPKGFFPIQDTGVIQGISEAAQTVSFGEMSNEQQALAKIIMKDPAVDSLSSFIGIDGTNTTLNSGRIQINLKPLDERKINASDVIRRLQPELAAVPGITLFMQPVQDITVEDRVSRTEFQYTLEDANADELNRWRRK
jgi:multidrug efflux pump